MAKTTLNNETFPKTAPVPKEVVNRFTEAVEDLLEYLEYSTPEFWEEIEESRKSGRVKGEEVKRRLGL